MKIESCLVKRSLFLVNFLLIFFYLFLQSLIEGKVFLAFVFSAIVLPLWPAFLSIISIFSKHFCWKYALYATLTWIVWDLTGINYWFVELFEFNNPQWVTIGLMLISTVSLVSVLILGQRTLFRLIMLFMMLAQMVVMPIFHAVTIDIPMNTEKSIIFEDRKKLLSYSDSRMLSYCEDKNLLCLKGSIYELSNRVQSIPHNYSLLKTIREAQSTSDFYHTWQESSFPSANEKIDALRFITYLKRDNIGYVFIDEQEPNLRFKDWAFGFSVLSTAFHFIWIGLITYVLGRHRSYAYRSGRWEIEHPPKGGRKNLVSIRVAAKEKMNN